MSSDREALRLQDIVENIDRIDSHVEGLDRDRFLTDAKTVDAVERCLQRITETVIKIGPDPHGSHIAANAGRCRERPRQHAAA